MIGRYIAYLGYVLRHKKHVFQAAGERYPCRDDIFRATYEPVHDGDPGGS